MAREDPALERRDHRLLVADDRREQLRSRTQPGQQVLPELLLQWAIAVTGGSKLPQRGGTRGKPLGNTGVDRSTITASRDCMIN